MSIEATVRNMLTTASGMSVPDQRITLGYRLQDSVLPAITFEVTSQEKVSFDLGYSCEIELRAIAETTSEALDISAELQGAVRVGTWQSLQVTAALWLGTRVEPPSPGEGDESMPAEVICTAQLFYK